MNVIADNVCKSYEFAKAFEFKESRFNEYEFHFTLFALIFLLPIWFFDFLYFIFATS